MRTFIISVFLISVSYVAIAQEHENQKEMVGFACYYGGTPTKTVEKMIQLIEAGKFNIISKQLTSNNSGEKFLAVIILQRLADTGKYQLSSKEEELIKNAEESEELVPVCSGCTYFDNIPINKLLTDNTIIGAKFWLDSMIAK